METARIPLRISAQSDTEQLCAFPQHRHNFAERYVLGFACALESCKRSETRTHHPVRIIIGGEHAFRNSLRPTTSVTRKKDATPANDFLERDEHAPLSMAISHHTDAFCAVCWSIDFDPRLREEIQRGKTETHTETETVNIERADDTKLTGAQRAHNVRIS